MRRVSLWRNTAFQVAVMVMLAAVLTGKARVDGTTAILLSGGNVDPAQFRDTVLAGI